MNIVPKLTKAEIDELRAKCERGSNGGKQMAKLSSRESRWLLDVLATMFPAGPE